jgi:FtsP/CotA-like multicopper oxidase with cupredoxin domain
LAQPTTLFPAFQKNEPARDWWGPYVHQRYDEFPAAKFYQIDVVNANWKFHRELPAASLFTYGGTLPGTSLRLNYGEPVVVRINNQLANIHYGFGFPDTATHLHNMHTPAESDGYPGDFVTPGNYRDQHYPMIRSGYDTAASPRGSGDSRESLGTLWYHDHRIDHTAENVYRGLYAHCVCCDEFDSADEDDRSDTALRLPSGECDVMLSFLDPQFDSQGNIFFDVFDTEGHLGDKVAVNGKIQPFLDVQRRKYRLRLLDAGPSRYYQFYISKGLPTPGQKTWAPMNLIACDGNLLEKPLPTDHVFMAVASRKDIVVDFSSFKDGDTLYLVNRMEQTSGRGPTYNLMDPGVPVLQFRVHGDITAPDDSDLPSLLRPLARPTALELSSANHRLFEFDRTNGSWAINNRLVDLKIATATIKRNSTEIWTLKNSSGSWSHPIHVHFEEFQMLSRNGAPPPPEEAGRMDVANLGPNDTVQVFFRFNDFTGRYVMHCHNVVHEDHAMMIRFDMV